MQALRISDHLAAFVSGMTCPLLRQHGARDHTCPWFYGPEAEKIIEDIIKLRHAMKPYYVGSQVICHCL
jgi:alpha-glucosidase (family GH31 glycosyl hydrolase)